MINHAIFGWTIPGMTDNLRWSGGIESNEYLQDERIQFESLLSNYVET